MPRYLYPDGKGLDSEGKAGPTLRKAYDRYMFNKEKARVGEMAMDAALPLGLTSTEAQGAILPASLGEMLKVGSAYRKGATERQIFDDLGMVRSSKDSWGRFEPDMPKDLASLFSKNKHGFYEYKGPEKLNYHDVFAAPNGVGNVPINMRKDMPANVFGELKLPGVREGVYDPTKSIDLNVGRLRTIEDYLGTLGHEGQHLGDNGRGLSHGYSVAAIPQDRADMVRQALIEGGRPKNIQYGPMDHYLHNIGEVRGRQNDMLNMRPEQYDGLASVFKSENNSPMYEEAIWGR